MSRLAIDIGNTNCKIKVATQAVYCISNQQLLAGCQIALAPLEADNHSNLSSVIKDQDSAMILKHLSQQLRLNQDNIKHWQSLQILKLALPEQHQQLGHLGSDRALRIKYLSQFDPTKYQIGIGCGSAFTVEVIYQQRLVESLIIPGLAMQLASLSSQTAKLPPIAPTEVVEILASQQLLATKYAIVAGIINSYMALISSLNLKYTPQQIVCSGGYASLLAKRAQNLNLSLIAIPYLEVEVLQKLAEITP